ncbi:MAG: choice-of-anchor C family protein, partial [Burkholderiaceae bacterium]
GVTVGGTGIRFTRNSFYGNNTLGTAGRAAGISLAASRSGSAVLANDGAKAGGANLGMDHPVFGSAVFTGDQLQVVGRVGSAAGQTTFANATVEVFRSSGAVGAFGEGRTYLGTVTADGTGLINERITLPVGVTLTAGETITGTATDASGNTSEFGPNLAVSAAAALQNGDFESGVAVGTTSFLTMSHADATSLPGWVSLFRTVDLHGATLLTPAASGGGTGRSVDLAGTGTSQDGGIQQSFITTSGTRYSVVFAYAGNPACGAAGPRPFTASAAGVSQAFAPDTTGRTATTMVWQRGVLTFTASSPLTTLRFQSNYTASDCGPVIDAVSIDVDRTVSGTVFEDVNYGGGAGRSRGTSGGAGVPGATVELIDALGTLRASTTTAANGSYSFLAVGAGEFMVRVVQPTVASTRSGTSPTLRAVQTFRSERRLLGGAADVVDEVGGMVPTASADTAAGASGYTWTACATENHSLPQTCVFTGTRLVRYGIGSTWTTRVMTGGALCMNTTFGDPAVGSGKSCQILDATPHSVSPVSTAAADATGIDFGYHFGTVVNTNDSGNGSLRQAIFNANTLGGDTSLAVAGRAPNIEHIVFMIPNGSAAPGLRSGYNLFSTPALVGTVATIPLASPLTALSSSMTLDAQTQPGWTQNPLIEIDVSAAGASTTGLVVSGTGSVVRGLIVNRHTSDGVRVEAANATVQGNWIGLRANGTGAGAFSGIWVTSAAINATIGGASATLRNVVSGNATGLYIGTVNGAALAGGTIVGNYIGTDPGGTTAVPNTAGGIVVDAVASGVAIGGVVTGEGNLISGNTGVGLTIAGPNTQVRGNRIGTDLNGTQRLPNTTHGISVATTAIGSTIGGTTPTARNLVSGNTLDGIQVDGGNLATAMNLTIAGNYIGTDVNGTSALRNARHGVYLTNSPQAVIVGGTGPDARNLISGNSNDHGVLVDGTRALTGTALRGNWIGLDANGAALANGVGVGVAAPGLTVGGAATNTGNTISANTLANLRVAAANAVVQGNWIGLNGAGTAAVVNPWDNVQLLSGATNTRIGGAGTGEGNVISGGNVAASGIAVFTGATGVVIQGNTIGLNATRSASAANGHGVWFQSGTAASNATVGGTAAGAGNLIANNAMAGVAVIGTTARVSIRGNSIYGNVGRGIDLSASVVTGDGANANDGVRVLGGGNEGIDTPVITRAVLGASTVSVVGYIGSAPLQSTWGGTSVDVYVSSTDALTNLQGRTYIGTLTTNADGEFAGVLSTSGISGLVAGTTRIIATTVDAVGNTSEFGNGATTVALAALANGGFESGTNPGGSFISPGPGDATTITGWVVTGNAGVDYIGGLWTPAEGSRSVDLSAGARGGVAQAVQTVPGQQYTLTYAYAGNGACSPTVKTLRATVVTGSGSTSQQVTFDTTSRSFTAMGWTDRSLGFTATAESTVIWFESLDATACGPTLDNVRLTTGPPPNASISGTVFEDVNYGGGAGRPRSGLVGASPRQGARVELYDAAGALAASTTTDVTGAYSFTNRTLGDYTVRVVSSTVTSGRTGASSTLVPVPVYRVNASGSTAIPDTAYVGGAMPSRADAGNGSTTLAALSTSTTSAQAITTARLAGDLAGVDFGFNFDTVVNVNDAGQGSLRQALLNANALGDETSLAVTGRASGVEHLIFMLPDGVARPGLSASVASAFTGAVATIQPATSLPSVSGPLVIDAQQQPGWSSSTELPRIALDGTLVTTNDPGLVVAANDSTVRGLSIVRFRGMALSVSGSRVRVLGNHLGIDATGTVAMRNNTYCEICVSGADVQVGGAGAGERNLIRSYVETNAARTRIVGNWIGLAKSGATVLASGTEHGIYVGPTATDTVIGTTTTGEGNVIGGNGPGIGDAGQRTAIRGNRIGTTPAGDAPLANASSGITLYDTSRDARVESNLVSGNGAHGISVIANAAGAQIRGNTVGLDALGATAIPNTSAGIRVDAAAIVIGGTGTGEGNLIAGNGANGIVLTANASGSTVTGNLIGLSTSDAARGNGATAVLVQCTTGCTIGGAATGAGITISASTVGRGIDLNGSGSVVQG